MRKLVDRVVSRRFLIFCLSGTLVNGFGYCVYAILVWSKVNYLIANTLSFLCAIWLSFLMNTKIVFRIKTKLCIKTLVIYAVFYSTMLLISLCLLGIWVKILGNLYLAQLINIILCALVSYFGLKIIFKANLKIMASA
jgi:putative flippase GtrA